MKVIILRGISGSGKTTWIANNHPEAFVVSADHHFLDKDGNYHFNADHLQEAHEHCFRAFLNALEEKRPLIAVDNTNVALWEITPYSLGARAFGYDITILTLSCSPELAISRKQLVPEDHVRRTAHRLAEETKRFPAFLKAIHTVIPAET
jgi:predicted kinase